ncbi:MAG: SRPBCC family protein [Planctomycetales bacterium]|nr:SRPBCC family protein [Planctomycetales bacterium]
MKLLPYDTMTIHVPLPVESVKELLRQHVAPVRWFRRVTKRVAFKGQVSESRFKISRSIEYRNSFLPFLDGTFEPEAEGTTIHVRLTLHPLVVAFLCCWFGSLVLFAIGNIFPLFRDGEPTILFAVGGFAVFSALLTLVGFWAEVPKSRRLLSEIFAPPK